MAFGVEVRVPLLDHELIEHVAQFSPDTLVAGQSKRMLRQSMRSHVPDKILDQREKHGFAAPLSQFLMRKRDATFEMYSEMTRNVPFLEKAKCQKAAVGYLRKGNQSLETIFWRTLSLAIWYNKFFDARELRTER